MLSGPSGVGKDTVLDEWIALDPRVRRVVTTTTRAPRVGEVDGVDYDFVAPDEFLDKARAGEFLEFKEVHGAMYASPLASTLRMRDEGLIPVLKIDLQGALEAMVKLPDATTIFLLPPSIEELEKRLRGRGTDAEDAIDRRMRRAFDELDGARHYHHRIENRSVADTVAEIRRIVGS